MKLKYFLLCLFALLFTAGTASAFIVGGTRVNNGGTGQIDIPNNYMLTGSSTNQSLSLTAPGASSTVWTMIGSVPGWAAAQGGSGGGLGTVTSVDMSVPTGLAISGNPITTSGTLALSLGAGYNIPLTASTTNWNGFYNTPSTRITAGTNLNWSGNTLGVNNSPSFSGTLAVTGTTTLATTTITNLTVTNCTGCGTASLTNHQNIIYVGKWGNDSNNGLTPNTPKLTIANAITIATLGNTIFIYPGTYNESDLYLPFGVNLMGTSPTSTVVSGVSNACSIFCLVGNNEISNIGIRDGNDSGNCINITTGNAYGATYIFRNIDCKARLDNIYTVPFFGLAQNIHMKIYDSIFETQYDGLTFFASASSTFEVYNSKIIVTGGVATTRITNGISICNMEYLGVDQPQLIVKDTIIIASRTTTTGDVAAIGIAAGSLCSNGGDTTLGEDGAYVIADNVYFDVTSPVGKTAYGIYNAILATSTIVEVYNSHINTHGPGSNYDFGMLNGTATLGGVNDWSTSTGTRPTIKTINIGNGIFNNGNATTTISVDNSSSSKGACLKLKDVDGSGYTYVVANNGVLTASTSNCQ